MKTLRTLFIILFGIAVSYGVACTSAITGARLNPHGHDLMWKHRDTGTEQNFVAKVHGKRDYVALFNGGDSLLSEAWTGFNRDGFAIMNTASYNLRPDTVSYKDREGAVMTAALNNCATLADFETLLDTLPRPMGVQANFGVLARDGGAYYEVTDDTWLKYSLDDAADDYIVRTNYSYSGNDTDGFGYIREANELHLLKPFIESSSVTPDVFTEVLSRSFYHSMFGRDMLAETTDDWLIDQDFIPRNSSSASVVIESVPGKGATGMWIALGYPPCSIVRYVTVDSVPGELMPDKDSFLSPFCTEVIGRKNKVFPIKRGSGSHYIDVNRLRHYNDSCRKESLIIYKQHYEK